MFSVERIADMTMKQINVITVIHQILSIIFPPQTQKNGYYDHYTDGFDECVDRVENFPAADVEEVKHGKWIKCSVIKCSVCGSCTDIQSDEAYEKFIESYYYCPVCGSKLDLEDQLWQRSK